MYLYFVIKTSCQVLNIKSCWYVYTRLIRSQVFIQNILHKYKVKELKELLVYY